MASNITCVSEKRSVIGYFRFQIMFRRRGALCAQVCLCASTHATDYHVDHHALGCMVECAELYLAGLGSSVCSALVEKDFEYLMVPLVLEKLQCM